MLSPEGAAAARTLLEAQRHGLLMYASCGWFFNDLAGLETVQILRYAARSMDLYRELGEEPPVEAFLAELSRARSNDPTKGDGRQIWVEQVDGISARDLPAPGGSGPAARACLHGCGQMRGLRRPAPRRRLEASLVGCPPWRRPPRPATGTRTAGRG